MAMALVVAGCSDDSSSNKDTGPGKDITVLKDGGGPTPDGYVPSDGPVGNDTIITNPDGSTSNTCTQACMDEAPFLCLEVTVQGETACVECTSNAHCQGNPNSLGPTCDTQNYWCTCASNAECATNPNGSVCESTYTACSCTQNSDCPTGKACTVVVAPANPSQGDPGLKICGDACAQNSDCTDTAAPFCDTRSGLCVACLNDGDCSSTPETPNCADVGGGQMECVECGDDADCVGSIYGSSCDQNYCSCSDATDCAYPEAWGGACVTHSTSFGSYQACGCDNADNSQCTGVDDGNGGTFDSAFGTVCNTDASVCGCTDNTNCGDTTKTTCALIGAGSDIQQCQEPCTANADCEALDVGLDVCDTTSGRCIECDANNACADGVCDTSSNTCVECLTDNDCTSSFAPKCAPDNTCVECLQTSDCAASIWGAQCDDSGSCGCLANSDCGAGTNGPTCEGADTTSGDLGYCTCDDTATTDECAAADATRGKVCQAYQSLFGTFYGCGCNDASSDCASGKKCGMEDGFGVWPVCLDPCSSNADCTGEELTQCNTTTELCVACMATSDCTAETAYNQCGKFGTCVECDDQTPCTANSLGPNCDAVNGWCECASNSDCASSPYGTLCDTASNYVCSCDPTDASTCPSGKACTGEAFGTPICE